MRIRQMAQTLMRQKVVQASLVLCLVVGALLWKVVFLGYALLPADIVFLDPAWRDVAPEEYRVPQNPFLADLIHAFYGVHHLAAESIKAYRRIPLWNPYIFAGQPLVGNMQSSLFYPPNLLFWISDAVFVANVRGIFNFLFAGLFTFLLCRRLMMSKNGAILAAVAFSLSGPLVVWLGWPVSNVLACLPFLLWAGEGLLSGGRICFWSLLVGIGIALAVFGGHPGTTFHVVVAFLAYFLIRLWLAGNGKVQKRRVMVGLIFAVTLGVMLSSVQWMPFIDFLRESATLASGGRSRMTSAARFSFHWSGNLTSSQLSPCYTPTSLARLRQGIGGLSQAKTGVPGCIRITMNSGLLWPCPSDIGYSWIIQPKTQTISYHYGYSGSILPGDCL